MRVLVTGAGGLVGSGVATRLAADHEVVGLDLNPGSEVSIVGDCLDVAEWSGELGTIDAIVHVAALHAPHVGRRSEQDFRRANIEATARLLDIAVDSKATHFVMTSTTSLYGHALESYSEAVWVDEQIEPQPRDIYDETKLEAEWLVASAGNAMTVTSLRMSRCFPEPTETMAWYRLHRGIDRRDVAEAHALALDRKGAAATYVISAASPFRREDRHELRAEATAVIERRSPGLIERMAARGWAPPGSIDRVYDCSLAQIELGFRPRYGVEDCLLDDWDPAPSV
jgi:nucleoside-diphosphate-sugar epimerase